MVNTLFWDGLEGCIYLHNSQIPVIQRERAVFAHLFSLMLKKKNPRCSQRDFKVAPISPDTAMPSENSSASGPKKVFQTLFKLSLLLTQRIVLEEKMLLLVPFLLLLSTWRFLAQVQELEVLSKPQVHIQMCFVSLTRTQNFLRISKKSVIHQHLPPDHIQRVNRRPNLTEIKVKQAKQLFIGQEICKDMDFILAIDAITKQHRLHGLTQHKLFKCGKCGGQIFKTDIARLKSRLAKLPEALK